MSPVPLPGGGVFWAPLPPCPLPPGVRVSPRSPCFPQGPGASMGPGFPPCASRRPWVRASRHAFRRPCFPKASSMLSGDRDQGPCFQVSGAGVRASALLSCFQGPGARLSGFQEASRWQASRLPGFLYAFRRPCFQEVFRRPCFQASRLPASMLSVAQGPGFRSVFSSQHLRLLFLLRSLQASRGPGPGARASHT